ncbi:MAG TPA: MerR family transcriptional regulator [Candidatus Scybalocola faecigallinarum]|uniref:MerR family transcriptional regulator n=1 Tax=Candidatus Scybalocola faecigallinarum TaxID=2840941 RepID=A0A9D1JQD3_9FIRM|nr:MerR family transcriptional regulator [Candidatus Scybalocola faecigallinarum]
MTIKEAEERTGLSRSNIRFYEKEKLIEPSRNESNGYRDYSENDVENIKKIAYLRTLGISIEDIRSIISEKVTLRETLEKQNEVLKSQIVDLNKAKLMCEKMLDEESISYEKLHVEQYITDLHDYWKDNQTIFKLDSVSFLYIWGSMLTWTTITALCLIIGALFYSKLPAEIPVQWRKGMATSFVNKNWIFICPVMCIIIRYLLKPFIYAKLQMNNYYGEIITEYLTNYMCFIVLSVEIFSVLFIFGVVKSVVILLFVNTAVFIGLLVVGLVKMDLSGKGTDGQHTV